MFNHRASCCFVLVFCFFTAVFAQSSTPDSVPTDPSIAPILKDKNVSEEEKKQVLDFIRKLGEFDLDKEINLLFEKLPPTEKEKVRLVLETLQLPKMPRTTVEYEVLEINLGNIPNGKIIRDTITLKNTGRHPYFIFSSQSSCDCTVLRQPELPVMPGESDQIFYEFDSAGKLGEFRIGIVIQDNSSPNSRIIIYLNGTVVPRVKLPGEQ